jgi:hypothetical protein
LTQNNLPAYLQQYQVPDLGSTMLGNLGAAMPPHVNIGDGRFTLVDAAGDEIMVPTHDPQIGVYLDACIVDVADVKSRIYYEGNYDKKQEGKRPVCYSDNGIGPSIGSSIPQAPTCAACPRAEWTKINANGNKVPWCTEKYKIALLVPGFQTVFLLAVPPASHGPLREYTALCKGNGALVANLVTRMWFVSQGVLGFRPVSYIDEAVARLRQEAYVAKLTDTIVGRGDIAKPAHQIAAPAQQINAPQAAYAPTHQQPMTQGQIPFVQGPAPAVAQAQQFVPNVPQQTQQGGAFQQPSGQQRPAQGSQQVQQPGPFANQPNAPAAVFPSTQPTPQASAVTAPTEPQQGRRKRRTAAEIAAANGGAPGGPQQAPFPHPGQEVPQTGPFTHSAPNAAGGTPFGGGVANAGSQAQGANPQQLEFGIGPGQDAAASPEVKGMLDNFFGGQT